ncbi:3-deoxy-D-manno-octulosonic acid transferase [Roseateles sp. DAIF2]|uniref:3-deoxy-D-manno-octulosonic acid transferase n=1 Tax=Roseateles sp. DAIF2 TaxID=2714952 RepID=UPI0018A25683|nr:3-deoxy-D-manno-octulosonic acid transferase [Roseateles sp. DAIF2]QPF73826.1 3-deoxy-D-manno-octulosonic acid transferase [Roseateles sp. DAIF2]
MKQTLARWLYAALLRLATPLYLLKLWRRGAAEPLYRAHWGERLGLYRGPAAEPGRLWLHAVSLGETRAAAPLIAALRTQRPGLKLLLTHGTATGREAGQALLQASDVQAWLPYDTPGAVRRFLRHWRPAAGVLMETEIWPALQHAARKQDLPLVLANARLSEKSLRQGRRLAALMRPAAEALSLALAQTEDDARRLREAGVARAEVAGNLKYDLRPDAALLARGRAWRARLGRPVLLGAVTREGEEALLLQAFKAEYRELPPAARPLLLIVPRHPQRFDEVAALVAGQGLTLARRSAWAAADKPPDAALLAEVWLGDSLREMPLYYGLADLALLGGSFAPLGGQNLIESAACGCPLLLGPHTFNFAEAAELALAAGAARRVADLPAALAAARALLGEAGAERGAMAQAATAFAAQHRGAAERMAARILQLLQPVA